MSSRTFPVQGIVLRARPMGEKDRVLAVLTAERGVISLAARGARNPKSKLAAASQPFTLARFLVAKGRSLDIATQAEIENAHTHISGDLLKTSWASYFCELAAGVPEELPDESLFQMVCIALDALDQAKGSPSEVADEAEIIGRWFEVQRLAHDGYSLAIGRCVVCDTKISVAAGRLQTKVAFSAESGGTLCATCAPREGGKKMVAAQTLRALHQLERASRPPQSQAFLERLQLSTPMRSQLETLLQAGLQSHLHLRLRSLAFLNEVRAANNHPSNS